MYPFPKDARVAFIGDSITHDGWWPYCVADYYRAHYPELGVQFLPTAISGGTTHSALLYLRDEVMRFAPTHVVVMLGTNDIEWYRYPPDREPNAEEQREIAFAELKYRSGLVSLLHTLSYVGKVSKITLIKPIPHDYSGVIDGVAPGNFRADRGLRRCGEIMAEVAPLFRAELLDFYTPVRSLMDELADRGLAFTADRVHPTENGYHALARLFLLAQGCCDVAAPTVASMADGSVKFRLLPETAEWRELWLSWQKLFKAQWLVGTYAPDQRDSSVLEFAARCERSDFPEWYGEWYRDLARHLVEWWPKKDELEQSLRSQLLS